MKKALFLHSTFTKLFLLFVVSMYFCTTASAIGISGIMSVFDASWTQFNDDSIPSSTSSNTGIDDGTVGPGGGGQDFDAEYLFYRYDTATNYLELGLQAGFDLMDGHFEDPADGLDYWAGDLALKFTPPPGVNGDPQTISGMGFTHAVDFGLETRDFTGVLGGGGIVLGDPVGGATGINAEGLYAIHATGDILDGWNNDVHGAYAAATSPFAMETGTLVKALRTNRTGSETNATSGDLSYYRIVGFDASSFIDGSGNLSFGAHWTMSCGNDSINGFRTIPGASVVAAPVPEPTTIALLGIGLAGLGGGYFRRRIKRNKSKVQK